MKDKNLTRKAQAQPQGRAFDVTITETLKRKVRVYESELKEPTLYDAEQTVSDWWHNGQIILVAEDFVNVEFEAEEIAETNGEAEEIAEIGTEGGGQDG